MESNVEMNKFLCWIHKWKWIYSKMVSFSEIVSFVWFGFFVVFLLLETNK